MGSRVSGRNRHAEHRTSSGHAQKTLPLWLRYVDDTFTAVHKDEIDFSSNTLTNRIPTYSSPGKSKKTVK